MASVFVIGNNWKINKIRDLFKVKLYIIRSETKRKREREIEKKKREREREKNIYVYRERV